MNEIRDKTESVSNRIKGLVPDELEIKSFLELLMIATAILTLALI